MPYTTSLLNKSRNVLAVVVVFLCLVPIVCAPQESQTSAAARQAAAVDENVAGFQERQTALGKLQEAVRLFLSNGETLEAARVLNRVGRLQLIMSEPEAAVASYEQALELLKQTPSAETRIDNLNGLGAVYLHLEELTKAGTVLGESVAESEASHYTAGQAQALLVLSGVQNYDSHLVALATAQSALPLWQSLGDKPGLARTYDAIGQYYLTQNLLPEATQNRQMALDLWRELKDKAGQAGSLIGLAQTEQRKGSWDDAIAFYLRAQDLVDEQAEPKRMGQIQTGLAEAANGSGLPETGLLHFRHAEGYYQQTGAPYFIAYAVQGLGWSQYLLGNYDEAVQELNRSIGLVESDSPHAAQCHEYLGRVYIAKGEYETALEELEKSLDVYTRASNPRETARAWGLIGEIHQQQGRMEPAREYYQKALNVFVKLSDNLNQAAVLYALGRLELETGNYDPAENYLRQSIAITENVRRVSTSRDLMAAFSATVYARYQAYADCLMRKHEAQPDRGFDVTAFESSELARGRSLAELLRATQTNRVPGLEAELADEEKSLRQSLRVKEDYRVMLLSQNGKQAQLAALKDELSTLETKYKQVTETIRARYPAYDEMSRPTAWNLQQIQEKILADDDTVLLEYSLGHDRSYVWAVTRTSIHTYKLPAESEINNAAQKVYELLASFDRKRSDELTAAVQTLSGLVLAPVSAELNKQHVIVVADGALNYIPFQILSPSNTSDPLVASAEVVNAPSASILGQLRGETAERRAPAKVLLAFGDPVFVTNFAQHSDSGASVQVAALHPTETDRWPQALRDIDVSGDSFNPAAIEPLFYATRELANLRQVAGPETSISTGFDATRESLASADLSQYAILHFATHGVLNPKRPEISGLFLSMIDREGKAQNGFVGLQDIYRLHAPVDLVVLSACRTGLGKDVRGEGLIGLTRGFMYAGASSVMASLWKVDDEATAELMKRFYANMLQGGMTPAAALRAAQNSIRQEPQWRSPRYWAAFTLQGEYRQVIKHVPGQPLPGSVRIVIALSLLLLLAAGIKWYRRTAPRLKIVKS